MKSISRKGRRKLLSEQRILVAVILSALMSSVCFAGTYEYVWDSSNPKDSFGDGKVTLTLDGSTISAMSVGTETGDVVTFSGTPMSFSAGAEIRVDRGTLDLANGMNAAGDISCVCGMPPTAWVGTNGGLYGDVFTTVLTDTSLSDIEIVSAHLNFSATGGGNEENSNPYHVTRGSTWMEVQLQEYLGSGNSTKVVKIRLEQFGADIKAKMLYAKYVRAQNAIGEDFDNPSGRFEISDMGVRTSTSTPDYHYGCDRLRFVLVKGIVAVKVSGPFSCAGKIDVAEGVGFEVVNQPTATVNRVELPSGSTFSVVVDGIGPVDDVLHDYGYVPNSGWTLFAANRSIKDMDVESIAGTLAGSSLSSTPVEAWGGYARWISDTVLSVQFQMNKNSSYTKGVLVKLRQAGSNVEFIAISCHYYEGGVGTKSFEGAGVSAGPAYATSPTTAGYCVASFSAAFTRQSASRVTLSNGGAAKGGTIEVLGESATRHAELRVTNKSGLPTNGVVNVGRYGVLSLINSDTAWDKGLAGGSCVINVQQGGKLRQGGDSPFSANLQYDTQRVIIDGGEAEFGCECTKAASSADQVDTSGSTYLNFLTLRNGARCYGKAVRLGNIDAKWTVEGTSPSVWDTGISLLAANGTAQKTVEFSIADVTSSEAVDFTVSGDMKMFNPSAPASYKNLHVRKTGAGTMKVNGDTDFTVYPLDVMGGVWMVGADSTMNTVQNINIDGGSFSTADGINASVGALSVGENGGGIIANANSTINFLDSTSVAWSGVVDVICRNGASVRFGTSSNALTKAQQKKLRLNGKRAKLDASGLVVPSGFQLSIR